MQLRSFLAPIGGQSHTHARTLARVHSLGPTLHPRAWPPALGRAPPGAPGTGIKPQGFAGLFVFRGRCVPVGSWMTILAGSIFPLDYLRPHPGTQRLTLLFPPAQVASRRWQGRPLQSGGKRTNPASGGRFSWEKPLSLRATLGQNDSELTHMAFWHSKMKCKEPKIT
ncbi:probable G-protein coupled receptor 160 isoform X2 [Sapajus apella]|uniref:Probable G-protein coupled receptor 160 isoform X2 n=1 Tax=Sapajus apella TaxID=9515 RepID=A0A6J3GF67_SAPAP|nr:probable G-protein coupled receptor 160 isoform X2 [Sapajus apella]XP_032116705.1 probable G-protein coupled receptor 160 isoform X2 [Sapajus apella]